MGLFGQGLGPGLPCRRAATTKRFSHGARQGPEGTGCLHGFECSYTAFDLVDQGNADRIKDEVDTLFHSAVLNENTQLIVSVVNELPEQEKSIACETYIRVVSGRRENLITS